MATCLTKAQCDRIMTPIRQAAIPALGINRHLSLVVAHGPQKYQGLGIPDLWTVQGIMKLWLALQHGDANTITGHQLRASMELHTLELGLPGQLLRQNYTLLHKLTTTSWIKHLWEFCSETNIQVESSTPQLKLSRHQDVFLMQRFIAYGYRDTQLYHLNLCRLFCHATRLSDITTGDGRRIHPASWSGHPTDSSGIEYSWPQHGNPSPRYGNYGSQPYACAFSHSMYRSKYSANHSETGQDQHPQNGAGSTHGAPTESSNTPDSPTHMKFTPSPPLPDAYAPRNTSSATVAYDSPPTLPEPPPQNTATSFGVMAPVNPRTPHQHPVLSRI